MTTKILERIQSRLRLDPNGCLSWTRYTIASGYAQITIDGKNHLVHRLVYEHVYGPIPNGLVIDHLCRNRSCCNPEHLEAVTPRENFLRGPKPKAKGRWSSIGDVIKSLEVLPNGCWERATETKHKGYATISFQGKRYYLHRLTYQHTKGPIPEGMVLDHLCRNKACGNPDHLEAVTPQTNIARSVELITHCPLGHPYAGDNLRFTPSGSRKCLECGRIRDLNRWSSRRDESNQKRKELYRSSKESGREPRQIPSHCRVGHPLTEEKNLHVRPDGGVVCRECARIRDREDYTPKPERIHCPKGHPYTPDNLLIPKDGRRRCHECAKARYLRFAHKKRNENRQNST